MSQLTEYNEHFKNILNSLNPSQKKAVESIEGPVMVIAGPGTGKTQVLAARIANILLETDTNPENILCLTFTDSAATNMRQRLQKFIGLAAFKVNIYTFHALCNDIIQQNLALFPKNNLEPLSELENLDIMKILIDNFDINHPLKRIKDEHYFYQNALKQLFSNIKKEGFDINYLIEHIDNYIQKLPENSDFQYKRAFKTFKKGDLKQEQYNQECERLEKLKAAILELPKYNALLLQNNRYDFDDMINWINNLFEHQPHIKNYYQEKFQYILVDEYQDTSLNQNKLVSYLSDFWDKPNLFVVGDDDQSIYRFQGANIQNLLEFKDKYITDLDTELVVLTDNYRSTPNIVNIAKQCIAFNTHRLSAEIPNIN
ncbi:MAG: UvrD-helicase domain-containing protein, partial [Alphaproteobacteria bacterium]|nr:UvrD-helicase domain-containing protein [Alphaproteobacteria bacterium]